MIGAHPDDEDTDLLALLAQGDGVDAAYLSLSRGDGGQNVIGEDLGIALGLLRSRELQAARAVDGAHQFFTRAFDFGFTRSLPETMKFWPPDSVLKDVVRVIRRFKPQVIVSVFTGTPRDGHGQHQMAGVMSTRAWTAAGDPNAYPELQTQEGLAPWTPLKFYRSARWNPQGATLTLSTGGIDPRTGLTYHQIAMLSRSQNRTQAMGQLEPIGPSQTRLELEDSRTAGDPKGGIFAGLPPDTTWLARFADSLRLAMPTARLADAVPALAAALKRAAAGGVSEADRALLARALAIAAGVELDATAQEERVVPGDTLQVALTVYDGGPVPAHLVTASAAGPALAAVAAPGDADIAAGAKWTATLAEPVPDSTPLTTPYFLHKPLNGYLYDWSDAPPAVRGLPFGPPVLTATAVVEIAGVPVTLTREVTYHFRDQAVGEVRRPLDVVPAVDVKLDPGHLVWSSTGRRTHPFTVTLTYNGHDAASGTVRLVPDGWMAPPAQRFQFTRNGESHTYTFTLTRPTSVKRADTEVRAVAQLAGGATYDQGVQLLDYPHIRPTPWVRTAESGIRVAPIALPAVTSVGYIRGAADRVPEALEQVGLPVTVLSDRQLATADLSRFDAIIIGSRAYETDSALMRHNDRLLAYVRRGGHLLVQYQQYQFINGHYAPYPLSIARPHDRVTDETAPVHVLKPNDPAFTTPNHIVAEDWKGWPQERGLYFAHTWDAHYTPLLEMHDAGMPPLEGGLLVARYGKGTYIYTGISFFRSLPDGVPGAFRLFLNLVAWKGSNGQ